MKAAKIEQATTVFAKALKALGTVGEKTETLANGLLRVVKSQRVRTKADLDVVVKAAYALNGWNTRQGRPTGEARAKVPFTVRTYVWELRSALSDGLPVWTYKSFYEMRLARKASAKPVAAAATAAPAGSLPDLPELAGIRIGSAEVPNGALFHDLVLLFTVIPEDQRMLLARNLSRLLHRYQMTAAPAVIAGKKRATG